MSYPGMIECEYKEQCRIDRDSIIAFKAEVITKLNNIDKSIQEIKVGIGKDNDHVWEAIDKIRDELKYIYLKMGFVSGVISLAVALLVSFLGK